MKSSISRALPVLSAGALLFGTGCDMSSTAPESSLSTRQIKQAAGKIEAAEVASEDVNTSSSDLQVTALRTLQRASATKATLQFVNGFPRSIMAQVGAEGSDSASRAQNFLNQYSSLYKQDSADLNMGIRRVRYDGILEHVTFYQTYKGLPVFGGELVVSLSRDQVVGSAGSMLTSETSLDITPGITAQDAESFARELTGNKEGVKMGATQLVIFDPSLFSNQPSTPRLAWLVILGGADGQVLIDAKRGSLLVQSAMEHSGALDDYDLDLEDANGNSAFNSNCFWTTTDDDYAGDEDGVYEDWKNDSVINNLWSISKNTYLFYFNTFDWVSYDNDGEQIELYGHSSTTGGASYSSSCDLFEFTDPFVGLDVMAHEFAHAVMASTSELQYLGESGALNESYADIMGAFIEGDWLMADKTPNGTIRDMVNPGTFSQPALYSNFFVPALPWDTNNNDDTDDAGGVHTNSGIWNKAASLLADGGTFNGVSVSGIGMEKMANLSFVVMRALPTSATMPTARDFTVNTALQMVNQGLFGFTALDVCSVRNSYAAVGIGSGDLDCDGQENSVDADDDQDFIPDNKDNCPTIANPDQKDSLNYPDGQGDICDPDDDNDGILDTGDNCAKSNPDQADINKNGLGDACEDYDLDGIFDDVDNCMVDANPDQKDSDKDGEGDVCDYDLDKDGVSGFTDNCQFVSNPDQQDSDGDGLGNACDPCPEQFNTIDAWTTGMPELGIPPKPMFSDSDGDGIPNSCDPNVFGDDTTVLIDGHINYDILTLDSNEHVIELGGRPTSEVTINLPVCPEDCPEYFAPDFWINLDLVRMGGDINVRITDDTGRAIAVSRANQDKHLVSFQPEGGRHYKAQIHFGSETRGALYATLSSNQATTVETVPTTSERR